MILFINFFEFLIESSYLAIFLFDYSREIINFDSSSTYLIGYGLSIKVIRRNNLALHLVQELVELRRLILVAPHKLTLKETHHFCAERLEVLMFQGRVATLDHSCYHPPPNSSQKLIDSSVEILEGLYQIFIG